MGMTAENVAEKYHVSREEQDRFAYRSQMRAKKAL
jgi:acetyl-CoA C-acetyltransferase